MDPRSLIPTERPNVAIGPMRDAKTNLRRAADGVEMPSQQSLDRGAARLRSRLSGRERELGQTAMQNFGFSGGNTGALQRANRGNAEQITQAYATGLTDLEMDQFEKQIKAAETLGNIGQKQGALATDWQGLADDWGLGMGELGAKFDANDIEKYLGQLDATVKEKLGLEDIGRQGVADKRKAITDLLNIMILGGNTKFREGKGTQFEALLQSIFGMTDTPFTVDDFVTPEGEETPPPVAGGAGGTVTTPTNYLEQVALAADRNPGRTDYSNYGYDNNDFSLNRG